MLASLVLTAVAFVRTARRQLGKRTGERRSKKANHNNTILKIDRQSYAILYSHYSPFLAFDHIFL